MKFYYSRNLEVRKHVNPKTGKIAAGGNFKAFNENWTSEFDNVSAIAENVKNGHGLCAWHLIDGKRSRNETGCIKAGLIIVDVDNQADGKDKDGNKIQDQQLTVGQALELDVCQKYLSFAYYSPSHEDGWPRFRLVFGLEKEIIDTGFYQWFLREISKKIPGSDIRATQVPNLFYGAKQGTGIIYLSGNYIPAAKIDQANQTYLSLPKDATSRDGSTEALNVKVDPSGVNLEQLLAASVRGILDGEEVEDRSFAMAAALKEIIGWCNWLNTAGIAVRQDPLDIANQVFENIYEYDPKLDGKFDRILGSITDVTSLKPAIAIATDTGEAAIWKKIKAQDRTLFDAICPDEVKTDIKNNKPKPSNSILVIEDQPTSKPTSTTTTQPKMTAAPTPSSPAQLIQLQSNNRQFSENDIADVIVNNYGDRFLFDSNLDEFFTYDVDEGIWYIHDEHHIKQPHR